MPGTLSEADLCADMHKQKLDGFKDPFLALMLVVSAIQGALTVFLLFI